MIQPTIITHIELLSKTRSNSPPTLYILAAMTAAGKGNPILREEYYHVNPSLTKNDRSLFLLINRHIDDEFMSSDLSYFSPREGNSSSIRRLRMRSYKARFETRNLNDSRCCYYHTTQPLYKSQGEGL